MSNYIYQYILDNSNPLIIFVTESSWFYYSILLYILSLHGIYLGKRNIIIALMSIELMLISIMLIFIFFSLILDDLFGQLSILFILAVGASESAVGLSLIIIYYQSYNWFLRLS